jgi:hypothetical protein
VLLVLPIQREFEALLAFLGMSDRVEGGRPVWLIAHAVLVVAFESRIPLFLRQDVLFLIRVVDVIDRFLERHSLLVGAPEYVLESLLLELLELVHLRIV